MSTYYLKNLRTRHVIAPRSYATAFPGTENPLSQGGAWLNGGTDGLAFRDVQCTPGFAFGTAPSASPPYDDPTAILAGEWGPNQTVEATVRVDAIEPGVNQEVELRLHSTIGPGRISGYEVLFSITTNHYIEIMRWEGNSTDIGQFTSIRFLGSGSTGDGGFVSPQLLTGYRLKATIDPTTGLIRGFVDSLGDAPSNGSGYVLMVEGTDTTYRSGAPGIGFFKHAGNAGPLSGAGFSYFSAVTF